MARKKAVTVEGDLLFTDLPSMVNRLLGVAYPELHILLSDARLLVFIPESAEGSLYVLPSMQQVSVLESREARLILETRHHGGLRGFPLVCMGPRLAFRVGAAHLTIVRIDSDLSATTRVNFEFVRSPRVGVSPYRKCFSRCETTEAEATEEEAARLLHDD